MQTGYQSGYWKEEAESKRKQNHCVRGKPYKDDLEVRAQMAVKMVAAMAAGGRGPRMSIPAGSTLHHNDCHDEDMYICDTLRDLVSEIEKLRKEVPHASHVI